VKPIVTVVFNYGPFASSGVARQKRRRPACEGSLGDGSAGVACRPHIGRFPERVDAPCRAVHAGSRVAAAADARARRNGGAIDRMMTGRSLPLITAVLPVPSTDHWPRVMAPEFAYFVDRDHTETCPIGAATVGACHGCPDTRKFWTWMSDTPNFLTAPYNNTIVLCHDAQGTFLGDRL